MPTHQSPNDNKTKGDEQQNTTPSFFGIDGVYAQEACRENENPYYKFNPFPYVRNWWRDTKWTDKTIALFTVVIAGAAIAQALEMRYAGAQTEKIITAANLIESHLNQTVTDNEKALAANKIALENILAENRLEFGKALDQNRESLRDSVAQSKAALDAAIAASQLDERAWVGLQLLVGKVEKIEGIEVPSPTIEIALKNTGKTPAIKLGGRVLILTGIPATDPIPEFDRQVAEDAQKQADALKSMPEEFRRLVASERQPQTVIPEGEVLSPEQVRTLWLISPNIIAVPDPHSTHPPTVVYALGKFTYYDIFQGQKGPKHSTEACAMWKGGSSVPELCPESNWMD